MHEHEVAPVSYTIRRAEASEIDVLVGIDADSAVLFEQAGLDLSAPALAIFARVERERWLSALENDLGLVACGADGSALGFIALGYVDGRPYLDQLSVMRRHMRRGIGGALLARAIAWSERELWLTTYAHLPWNAEMYARRGFARVDEARCGPELQQVLREQRAALPAPEQRIAMRFTSTPG